MPAVLALHTDKAIMEDAAIQGAIDNLPYVGAEEAVLARKDLTVDLFQPFTRILVFCKDFLSGKMSRCQALLIYTGLQ